MKNKKIKLFLASIFALSLALSVGAFAFSKEPLSVSASSLVFEGEEEESKDEEASNEETPAEGEQTPASGEGESTPASEETLEGDETSTPTVTGKPSAKEIFGVLKNAFVDAWKDLVAHIKKWLKLS